MRSFALLILLAFLVPGVAVAHPPCVINKQVPSKPRCVNKTDVAIHQLADNVGGLQQTVPGLTAAVNRLATATEQAQIKPPPPVRPEPFDLGDSLTLMAIIIALSAYLASLRLGLIGRCGRLTRMSDYLAAELVKEGIKSDDVTRINQRLDGMRNDMREHQARIRAISLIDAVLAVPMLMLVWRIFAPYLCESAATGPFFIALFFVTAIVLLLIGHGREWLKTLGYWVKPPKIGGQ